MSFQRMPNSGPFGDDHFDGLRQAALMSIADGTVPDAVIDYCQALEQRVLDKWFEHKREFAKSSWEQFRAEKPSA